jgi:hypothetical protein
MAVKIGLDRGIKMLVRIRFRQRVRFHDMTNFSFPWILLKYFLCISKRCDERSMMNCIYYCMYDIGTSVQFRYILTHYLLTHASLHMGHVEF